MSTSNEKQLQLWFLNVYVNSSPIASFYQRIQEAVFIFLSTPFAVSDDLLPMSKFNFPGVLEVLIKIATNVRTCISRCKPLAMSSFTDVWVAGVDQINLYRDLPNGGKHSFSSCSITVTIDGDDLQEYN